MSVSRIPGKPQWNISAFLSHLCISMELVLASILCITAWYEVAGDVLSCDAACECQFIPPSHVTVHCAGKSLPRIPGDIPLNVTYLDVSFNNIMALDGGNIKVFDQLKKLDLRNNLVSRLDSWAFQNLISLEELILDNNLLQSLTPYMFATASNLKMLSLSNNVITRIDNSAFIHLTLDSLNLRGNTKLLSLDSDMFKDSSIHRLILDGCGVSNIREGLLSPLAGSLKVLSLSNMQNGLLFHSSALAHLDLDILQLVQNKMSSDQIGFLSNPLSVKTLDMSLNILEQLDLSDLKGLQNTESLIFKKSNIKKIVLTGNKQSNLDGIREFDLRENSLTSFPVDVLKWMPNLQSLNIAHNPIQNISRYVRPSLQGLKTIDISNVSLACSCDLAWFANWRNTTKTVVIGELCSADYSKSPISDCSAAHALTAWVESNSDMSLDIFCRALGNPSPHIYLKRQQKSPQPNASNNILAISSDGEVHFKSSARDCFVYMCTASNYLGNDTLSFHVCPSSDWIHGPTSEHSQSRDSPIKVWILTIILSIALLGVLITLCALYVIRRRRRTAHRRLPTNAGSHVDGDSRAGSDVTLTRYGRDDDEMWNANELT